MLFRMKLLVKTNPGAAAHEHCEQYATVEGDQYVNFANILKNESCLTRDTSVTSPNFVDMLGFC